MVPADLRSLPLAADGQLRTIMPELRWFGYERNHITSHSMAVLSGSAAEETSGFRGESNEVSRFI